MDTEEERKIKRTTSTKIDHSNHRQRLMKTVTDMGVANANDFIILEFILTYVHPRIDTNPIAHRLMAEFGSISGVLDAPVSELAKIEGMGLNSAKKLSLLPEIFTRYNLDKQKHHKILSSRSAVIQYCRGLLFNKRAEEVYIICLNAAYKLLATKLLARGSVDTVQLDTKNLLSVVLLNPQTKYVVLTHCHPDNTCVASSQDLTTTTQIAKLLNSVGVELAEHVIVGYKKCFCILEDKYYEI